MLPIRFYETRVYERRAPLADLLADLNEVNEDNKKQARLSFFYNVLVAVGCATAMVMFSAFVLTSAANEWSPIVTTALILEAIIGFAGAFAMYYYFWHGQLAHGRKLEPRRFETILQVLRHVGRDVPAGQPLSVYVDFRATATPDFQREQTSGGNWWRFKYAQRWLDVSGRLADRTKFRLTIEQQLKRKRVLKRRVRDRDAMQESAVLTLSKPGSPRPSLPLAPRLLTRRWKGRAKLTKVDVSNGSLRATIDSPMDANDTRAPNREVGKKLIDHHQLLALFLACAQVWRMVRRRAAA